ncbi:hypothetical protein Tco_0708519 [Tanacetum coccineum]
MTAPNKFVGKHSVNFFARFSFEGDKLLSYSLHYKEIENGIRGKGANPYAKGGGEDADRARNATQVVFKCADQV